MNNQTCSTCEKAKSTLECGLCHAVLCKYCAQFLEEESFSFLKVIPSELSHSVYCGSCFAEKVAPELETHQQLLERAKNIIVYESTQGKETRLIPRKEKPVTVKDCADREETLLRLAFFAAQANYNAIVDVNLTSVKVKTGSYQTTKWSGTGVPVNVAIR